MKDASSRFILRRMRVRKKISGTAERPRLSIHRGLRNISAQLVDDEKGNTLVYISTVSPEIKDSMAEYTLPVPIPYTTPNCDYKVLFAIANKLES